MYGNPNITIRWDTIQIIFAAIFAFVFLFAVLLLLVNRYAVKQLTKMNYKNVLKCKRILLAFNFNPKTVWMVHLILAVASYETGNEADFIKYINLMKERKAQPAALYCHFLQFLSDRYFSYFSSRMTERQKENVIRWLGGDVGIISRWHETYNRSLFVIAGQTQTEIIDITAPFDTFRGDLRTLFCADGIHPNVYGYRLIADAIIRRYI